MAELIAQMETGQLQNENLEQPILELSRRLQNTKGKTVYGYLPPTAKALVDAIVDELAKEERVAAAYDLWNQMRERCAVPTQNNCRSACFFPNRKSSRPCATWSSGRCFSWGGVSIPQQMR